MLYNLFARITNHSWINRLLIASRLDALVLSKAGMYKRIKPDKRQDPQEMAGFSHLPEVQEAIDKAHADLLSTALKYIKPGDSVLDIGCGAGAYLHHFEKNYKATGIDLNEEMIKAGPMHVPGAVFIYDNFLTRKFSEKFHYIYSISVLEFIPPSKLDEFIRKVVSLLHEGGVLFLHYPHALSAEALSYPDLYYIEYSPELIEKTVSRYLSILSHEHAFDHRKITDYDHQPYQPGQRTFKNGYLLIAQKKLSLTY